jgi:hypothetical protein
MLQPEALLGLMLGLNHNCKRLDNQADYCGGKIRTS